RPGQAVLGLPDDPDGAERGHDHPAVRHDADGSPAEHVLGHLPALRARRAVHDLPDAAVLPEHPAGGDRRGPGGWLRRMADPGPDHRAAVQAGHRDRHADRLRIRLEQLPVAADRHQQPEPLRADHRPGQLPVEHQLTVELLAGRLGHHLVPAGRDLRRLSAAHHPIDIPHADSLGAGRQNVNARKLMSVWVATLAAAGGIAACSSGSSAPNSGSATHAHLTYALWDTNEEVGYKKSIAVFEKAHPSITVSVVQIPYPNYQE